MNSLPRRSLLVSLLVCWILGSALAKTELPEPQASTKAQEWQGFIACPRGSSGDLTDEKSGWTLITNQTEYESFVSRIPKERLQKRQPAPASVDPLLQLPTIPFDEVYLVGAWSGNVHIECQIENVKLSGEDLLLEVVYQIPPDYRNYAAPYGYGQYHCLVVPKFSGKVIYTEHSDKAP